MCLLVTQPEGVVFDDRFLEGVYLHNSDGIGVMYAEDNQLIVKRFLPKTEKDFIKFFRENIDNRKCSWHARMRTHGDINLDNCHPYQILSAEDGYPLYMAHNGVLHTGNEADPTKSDTWHYIQDVLRPMLLKCPELFMVPAFQAMIAEHIGNNRFVFCDAYGNMVTTNEDQGVQYNGAWLSNTYAWDTTGTEHDYSYYGGWAKSYGSTYSSPSPKKSKKSKKKKQAKSVINVSPLSVGDEDIDDRIDFCVALFDEMQFLGLESDHISWDMAEAYYNAAGAKLAWSVVDSLSEGAYSQEEIESEIVSMIFPTLAGATTNDDEEPIIIGNVVELPPDWVERAVM